MDQYTTRHVSTMIVNHRIEPRGRTEGLVRRASNPRIAHRDRMRGQFTDLFATNAATGETASFVAPESQLTAEELWAIYRTCGDVRAAVDAIARRISTWDHDARPTVAPTSEQYTDAVGQCAAVLDFLRAPNPEDTLQSLLFAWVVDALVFWHGCLEAVHRDEVIWPAGVSEPVGFRQGAIDRLVTVYSPTIFARRATEGPRRGERVPGWVQNTLYAHGAHWSKIGGDDKLLEPDQIVRIQLAPSSRSPYSVPVIETIAKEVTLLVRGTERAVWETDMGQIMPGILVLTGADPKVLSDISLASEQNAGSDWKITALHTPGATNPVQWVQLKRDFQEIQFLPLSKEARRLIYRNFGVSNVEMGDTEDTNRATASAELEVSGSALIEPLLEMIEQTINRSIVPQIIARDYPGAPVLCAWSFDRDVKLSASDELDRARMDEIRLATAQRSINELRQRDGMPRIEGGDVYRLADVPIGDETIESNTGEEPPDDDTGGSGVVQDDVDAAEATEARELDRWVQSVAARLGRLARRQRAGEDELPSEWQSPGKFDSVRTVDLRALWDQVVAYRSDVEPHWEEMRRDLVAAAVAADRADRLGGALHLTQNRAIMTELHDSWAQVVERRYEAVKAIALRAAREFAEDPDVGDQANLIAAAYYDRAMDFLRDLTTDIQTRVNANVRAVAAGRTKLTAENDLDGDSTTTELVDAIELSVDANEHRITNWSGRLVELTYLVLATALGRAPTIEPPDAPTIDPDPAEPSPVTASGWWYLWEYVGDQRMCETCETEGEQPARPLSQATVLPGGDTQCQANCRCVLTVWTAAEVADGTAQKINP